jgi:hypothetical protein
MRTSASGRAKRTQKAIARVVRKGVVIGQEQREKKNGDHDRDGECVGDDHAADVVARLAEKRKAADSAVRQHFVWPAVEDAPDAAVGAAKKQRIARSGAKRRPDNTRHPTRRSTSRCSLHEADSTLKKCARVTGKVRRDRHSVRDSFLPCSCEANGNCAQPLFDGARGGCYKLVHSFFACGAVAQLGARIDGIDEVAGSNPAGSTFPEKNSPVQILVAAVRSLEPAVADRE